jgi:hypothetical protein
VQVLAVIIEFYDMNARSTRTKGLWKLAKRRDNLLFCRSHQISHCTGISGPVMKESLPVIWTWEGLWRIRGSFALEV